MDSRSTFAAFFRAEGFQTADAVVTLSYSIGQKNIRISGNKNARA